MRQYLLDILIKFKMGLFILIAAAGYILKDIILSRSFLIFFTIQSIIFLGAGHKCWNSLMHIKNTQKKVEGFDEFSRTDSDKWNYTKLMIGFVFLVPFRIYIIIFNVIIAATLGFFVVLGYDTSKPMVGFRRFFVIINARAISRGVLFAAGYHSIKRVKLDGSYEQYLGKDYKEVGKSKNIDHYVSSVSNHFSWADTFVFMWINAGSSFVSSRKVKAIPLVGMLATSLNCVFVDRAATREQKDSGVQAIIDMQHKIDKLQGKTTMLHIFPEGACTNGQQLIPFKRGAFSSLLPLKPYCVRHTSANFSPANDTMPYILHMLVLFAQFSNNLEVIEMPIYYPTDFLFENHQDLGQENWEIYANSLRKIMAEILNLPTSEVNLRKKHELIEIMFGNPKNNKKHD